MHHAALEPAYRRFRPSSRGTFARAFVSGTLPTAISSWAQKRFGLFYARAPLGALGLAAACFPLKKLALVVWLRRLFWLSEGRTVAAIPTWVSRCCWFLWPLPPAGVLVPEKIIARWVSSPAGFWRSRLLKIRPVFLTPLGLRVLAALGSRGWTSGTCVRRVFLGV